MQSAPALRAAVIPAAVSPDVVDDREDQAELAAEVWRDAVRAHVLTRPAHAAALPLRLQRWAWLVALALHLILFLGLRLVREPLPISDANVMHVELIDMTQPEPTLPEPPSIPMHIAPRVQFKPPTSSLPSARSVTTSRVAPPVVEETTPHFRVYNPDGTLNIPDDLIAQIDRAQPRPNFIPLKVEPSPLLQRRRLLKVRPNHFDQYWNDIDSLPLHEAIWQQLTRTTEFTAPWGGQYSCTWVLVIVTCSDVPNKPYNPPQTWKPATQLDEE